MMTWNKACNLVAALEEFVGLPYDSELAWCASTPDEALRGIAAARDAVQDSALKWGEALLTLAALAYAEKVTESARVK